MFSASTSLARAAVSYSIRHSVFSRSGMSRRVSARSIAGAGHRPGGVDVLLRRSAWRAGLRGGPPLRGAPVQPRHDRGPVAVPRRRGAPPHRRPRAPAISSPGTSASGRPGRARRPGGRARRCRRGGCWGWPTRGEDKNASAAPARVTVPLRRPLSLPRKLVAVLRPPLVRVADLACGRYEVEPAFREGHFRAPRSVPEVDVPVPQVLVDDDPIFRAMPASVR